MTRKEYNAIVRAVGSGADIYVSFGQDNEELLGLSINDQDYVRYRVENGSGGGPLKDLDFSRFRVLTAIEVL